MSFYTTVSEYTPEFSKVKAQLALSNERTKSKYFDKIVKNCKPYFHKFR